MIGIVFLADLSVRGEAGEYGPGAWNVTMKRGVVQGLKEWIGVQKDKFAVSHDDPIQSASRLVKTLLQFFDIKTLGGHREFAKTHGTSRARPGVYGLIIVDQLRREFKLAAP